MTVPVRRRDSWACALVALGVAAGCYSSVTSGVGDEDGASHDVGGPEDVTAEPGGGEDVGLADEAGGDGADAEVGIPACEETRARSLTLRLDGVLLPAGHIDVDATLAGVESDGAVWTLELVYPWLGSEPTAHQLTLETDPVVPLRLPAPSEVHFVWLGTWLGRGPPVGAWFRIEDAATGELLLAGASSTGLSPPPSMAALRDDGFFAPLGLTLVTGLCPSYDSYHGPQERAALDVTAGSETTRVYGGGWDIVSGWGGHLFLPGCVRHHTEGYCVDCPLIDFQALFYRDPEDGDEGGP